ncbi:unnamed protein product [Cylicostephanus goldi]|uniref:Phlebovirus glycoprotein G2 fusion domain-containing protein n=1 Tax=Cylicostephanus goldi TaxID=71465 RepID=A0A3P6QQS8_CYLGO|nr:unnamed protein product [Cylicostephanus goldi]
MLTEIEAMLNSRPLTYQEEKWEEQPLLRPIDFLQKNMILDYPLKYIGEEGKDKIYHTPEEAQQLATQRQVEAALKTSIDLTEQFWKIWREQYLTSLREQHKIRMDDKRGAKRIPKIGDIVLLWDAVQPRNTWKTARIAQIEDSPSRPIREVVVETPNKRRLRRPINRIVPLEINSNNDETTAQQNKSEPSTAQTQKNTSPYNLRPRKNINYKEQDTEESAQRRKNTSTSATSLFTMMFLSIFIRMATGSPNNSNHSLQCSEGGVILTQLTQLPYEICAEDYCVEFKSPKHKEVVKFPPQITLHDHLVKWKTFDGTDVNIMEITCRAAPFCGQIDCVFCSVMITNPECWPRTAILVTGLIVYAGVAVCYCLFHVPVLMGTPLIYLLKITRLCLKGLIKFLWKFFTAPLSTTHRQRRRRISFSEAAILLAIIYTNPLQACQEVDIFTHHSRSCYKTWSKEYCTIDTTEILKINPLKQEACIRLRNKEASVLEVKLLWKNLNLICEKQTILYSRSTRYALLDSKRCPHAGSCTGAKCGKVNRTSKIAELHRANDFPGITGCVESCGGPGCDCFYPSSGCLFYRIYLLPNDEKVYELFKCNRWKPVVDLQLNINKADEPQQDLSFHLIPNQPKGLPPFIITLSSISIPPTPMLDTTFLTDGTLIAITPGPLTPPLVCNSSQSAANFTCEIREDCKCTPAEVKMTCNCKEVNLTAHIRESRYRLPVLRPNLELHPINGTVVSRIPQLPTAEFVLRIKGNFDTTAIRSQAVCTSEDVHCNGCYKCSKGAKALITCKSSTPTTWAEIQCEDDAFTVKCTDKGAQTNISFISDRALFYRNCTIKCGSIVKFFKITGLLHYTGTLEGAAWRVLTGESEIFSEINLPDFEHLAQTFLTWWSMLAATGLLVVIALLLTYLAISNACFCTAMRLVCRMEFSLLRLIGNLLRALWMLPFRFLQGRVVKQPKSDEKRL